MSKRMDRAGGAVVLAMLLAVSVDAADPRYDAGAEGLAVTTPPAPSKDQSLEAQRLVAQLSDADFATREQAGARLMLLGEPALSAVKAACDSPDPEVSSRASRLCVLLQRQCFQERIDAFVRNKAGAPRADLPGWREFKRLMAPAGASRRVYAGMYRADTELFETAFSASAAPKEGTQPSLSQLLEGRAIVLQNGSANRRSGRAPNKDLYTATLATLAVASARPDEVTERTAQLLTQISRSELAPRHNDRTERNHVTRKLLSCWVTSCKTNDLYVLSQLLQLSDDLKLEDASELALAIAVGDRSVRPSHPQFRATALLMVGKLGDSGDIPRLTPLLRDRAVCASQAGRGHKQAALLDVEIRDVALAVMLHLSGKRPVDSGFDDAIGHADKLFVLHTLAFRNDRRREEALTEWRQQLGGGATIRVAAGENSRTQR